MRRLGQVCIGFAGQRGRPKEAVARCATACRSCHMPTASAWFHTNAAPCRSPKPHSRHQALPDVGAAKDRSRQTKPCRERTLHRSACGQETSLILRVGAIPRRAWLGRGVATPGACTRALRNRRCVAAGARRCLRPSRNAGVRPGGNQGAALLGVYLTGRFTICVAAGVHGPARWYFDRSQR